MSYVSFSSLYMDVEWGIFWIWEMGCSSLWAYTLMILISMFHDAFWLMRIFSLCRTEVSRKPRPARIPGPSLF